MTAPDDDTDTTASEKWEKEVLARHRWGQHGDDKASAELARLRKLWQEAQPIDESSGRIVDQIVALEICNWNLEESILAICGGIGSKEPSSLGIGHYPSITDERWKKVWAYYLALRDWLTAGSPGGYESLLVDCDPGKAVQNRIHDMLGDRTELKELYVKRLSLCLERWIGFVGGEGVEMKTHQAAVSALEQEIKDRDPEGRILDAMIADGDGRLLPCSHKAFRRYDIIISSIGAGKWRAVMPMRGTDGFERAETLDSYLLPVESWIDAQSGTGEGGKNELSQRIHALLGKRDEVKTFQASLLVSLLRAQGIAARKRAESRTRKS